MNKDILERVVIDQQEDIDIHRRKNICQRPQEALINLNSNLAQVVIGVRRSGKSTLCISALERQGVNYAYVNFDDERLSKFDIEHMDILLETLYKVYGNFTHLFLDEIQNVDGWHLFVNRMLRKEMRVVLTGSNSKLLSGELATHLTGRHHTIELFPFSFADYCAYKGIAVSPLTTKNRGLLSAAFDDYMKRGGFPELLVDDDAKSYIDSLLHNIVTQDIAGRFKIKHTDTLMRMANHLLNISPSFIVRKKLMPLFGFTSTHTIGNYLSYLAQTYLISTVSKYSAKSRLRLTNEKCYAIDVAMMNNRTDAFAGDNIGWRMETIVYLELRRRLSSVGQDIYYYAEGSAEADFVVCDGNRATAVYQVSYSLSNAKTRRREIRGALAAGKATNCNKLYIITASEEEDIKNEDGTIIHVVPIWLWLIAK